MNSQTVKAAGWGALGTFILMLLIIIGSRNLAHFDAALVAYTFAVLFATFGLTYRYVVWLNRPPTGMYWRRGWQVYFRRGWRLSNMGQWFAKFGSQIICNRFIFRRSKIRGVTHILIMWGCIIAVLITFPLVFGWLHFAAVPGDLSLYEIVLFGFSVGQVPHDSPIAFFMFHGLVWASFLVIAGTMLAVRRRLIERGEAVTQRLAEDFMPLILLFAVSLTGLMLTASFTWLKGYAYTFIAILHAITVIGTFLWLPFGKFFHIFQRPAQLGVEFYKDFGRKRDQAHCKRCNHPFSSKMHIEDLIEVERQLGFRYEITDQNHIHYQWICPPCRRASVVMAQAILWEDTRGGKSLGAKSPVLPMPIYANPGLGEGSLGEEDNQNFHP